MWWCATVANHGHHIENRRPVFEMVAHLIQSILGGPFDKLDVSLYACQIQLRVHDAKGGRDKKAGSLEGHGNIVTGIALECCT